MKKVIFKLATLVMCFAILTSPMVACAASDVTVAIGTASIDVVADGTSVEVPVTISTTQTGTIDAMTLSFETDDGITLKSASISDYNTSYFVPDHTVNSNYLSWESNYENPGNTYGDVDIISPVTVTLTFSVTDTSIAKDYNICLKDNDAKKTYFGFNIQANEYNLDDISTTAGKISVTGGTPVATYPQYSGNEAMTGEEVFASDSIFTDTPITSASKSFTVFGKASQALASGEYGIKVTANDDKVYTFKGLAPVAKDGIWAIKIVSPDGTFHFADNETTLTTKSIVTFEKDVTTNVTID